MNAVLEAHGRRLEVSVPEDDHIGKRLAAGAWYERDLLDDLRKRILPGRVALDVGAHIGNHTLWMAGICGLSVIALEPNPESFGYLLQNVVRNALQVTCFRAAAGREGGRGHLELQNECNSGMTRVLPDADGPVEVMAIDSLDLQVLAVMKVDVEGAELDVLQGAAETIARCRPLIYAETEAGGPADSWLKSLGYRPFGRFCRTETWGYEI